MGFQVGQEYATSIDATFHETSAKNDTGIAEVFIGIAKGLLARRRSAIGESGAGAKPQARVDLAAPSTSAGKGVGCCGGGKRGEWDWVQASQ